MTIQFQMKSLEEFRIYPLKIRLFYRLNINCYKIVNKQILTNFYENCFLMINYHYVIVNWFLSRLKEHVAVPESVIFCRFF